MPAPLALFGMAGIVAAGTQALRWLFMSRLGLFIASALTWLGIGLVANTFVLGPTVQLLQDFASGSAGSGGGELYNTAKQWAGVLNFDKALTMIISAYVTRQMLEKGRMSIVRRVRE